MAQLHQRQQQELWQQQRLQRQQARCLGCLTVDPRCQSWLVGPQCVRKSSWRTSLCVGIGAIFFLSLTCELNARVVQSVDPHFCNQQTSPLLVGRWVMSR